MRRALLKAVVFRITVIIADFFALLLVFGDLVIVGEATISRHAIQILMYWLHEYAWMRMSWGVRSGQETRRRALLKTVTYRLFASGNDLFILVFLAGDFERGVAGTLAITVTNTVIYYLMERIYAVAGKRQKEKASASEA